MKKFLTTALALVCCLLVLAGCSNSGNGGNEGGDKAKAHIVLVLEDKTELPYDIEFTAGSNLRMALYEGGLIEEDQTASMYVENIDGHVADAFNDGVIWLPCDENGESLPTILFDEIIVEDGQTIYLQYYTVPYAD